MHVSLLENRHISSSGEGDFECFISTGLIALGVCTRLGGIQASSRSTRSISQRTDVATNSELTAEYWSKALDALAPTYFLRLGKFMLYHSRVRMQLTMFSALATGVKIHPQSTLDCNFPLWANSYLHVNGSPLSCPGQLTLSTLQESSRSHKFSP
jgi:hypothetical protein